MNMISLQLCLYNFFKKDSCLNMIKLYPLCLSVLAIVSVFGFFTLCFQNTLKVEPKPRLSITINQPNGYEGGCDLFEGKWIPDKKGSLYTNSSCKTIPDSKNCFQNGRQDSDFVNWKWKPAKCELPRFDPKKILKVLRGKRMAFIGDSVARNHLESLLCLLSQDEVPIDAYKDSKDQSHTWYFPRHNFTLEILWSRFLVTGEERVTNGSDSGIIDLHLDRVDENWSKKLPDIDYAIISDGHWFFQRMYLHLKEDVIGCVYCNEPNITQVNLKFALKMSFRAAFDYINKCEKCGKIVTIVRTFSPSHFEHGTWDTGGKCNRTNPLSENEMNLESFELEIRGIQVEETEIAKKNQYKRFEIMDITRAMLMRPDGHPGAFWGNKWMKGYDDCVHWCMPGPIDSWNDFLMAIIRGNGGIYSS